MDDLKNPPPSGGAIDDFKNRKPTAKVGIVLHTPSNSYYDFKIYVVDVDDCNRDYNEMKPAVRIKFRRMRLDVLTYCIANSTLYIFRGYNSRLRLCPKKRKLAYKHVLSPEDLAAAAAEVKVVEGEQVSSIADMTHGKGFPAAAPTPDGKQILVYSTCFIFKESFEAFELLNLDDDSWVTLPGLPCINCSLAADSNERWCHCKSDELVNVDSFSFVGKEKSVVFYLETDVGAFALDLGAGAGAEWISLDVMLGATADWAGYFETVKGRYVIMPGPQPVSDPTLRVYDFGDDGFFSLKRGDAPDAPADVIQLSRFDPPPESLWLKPLDPIVLPLRPQQEETACFIVRQLEGEQPDEVPEERMQQQEAVLTEEEFKNMDFVDMGYLAWQPEAVLTEEEFKNMDFVDMGYLAWQPEAVLTEEKFKNMDFVDMGYLAWQPAPDIDYAAFVPEPDEEMEQPETVESEEMEQPETVESEEMEQPESVESEPELEENFEEIYAPQGETRFLIEVCRPDLKSQPLKFNVPNSVSVRIPFHIPPYRASFFTL